MPAINERYWNERQPRSVAIARRITKAVTVTAARRHVQNPMRLNGTIKASVLPYKVSPTLSGKSAFTATASRKPPVQTSAILNANCSVCARIFINSPRLCLDDGIPALVGRPAIAGKLYLPKLQRYNRRAGRSSSVGRAADS
jgi:hypothetical protein